MFHVLLIIFLKFTYSLSTNPILVASPYPFNSSESSQITCFSNDQGIIQSMNIVAKMLDNSVLQNGTENVIKNESVSLIIPSHFNYSQLNTPIECRSKYHHGQQKVSKLDVFSVAEIPQNDLLTIDANIKQTVVIDCLAYGTNIFIHWTFSKDNSQNQLNALPIGIHMDHTYHSNDTLIIDHVSYSDHHGYYQCLATNEIFSQIYEDRAIIYLNVKKNPIWIPIVVVCSVIGICILILIIFSKYYRKKRNQQFEEKDLAHESVTTIDEIRQSVSNRKSVELLSEFNNEIDSEEILENIEESEQQTTSPILSQSRNSRKALTSSLLASSNLRTSPQFILQNPFLDPNVRPV